MGTKPSLDAPRSRWSCRGRHRAGDLRSSTLGNVSPTAVAHPLVDRASLP
jgi:hypothetical protein